ncbi:MAG: dihydroneopterin aldolase [Pseudomonadota bacterium]
MADLDVTDLGVISGQDRTTQPIATQQTLIINGLELQARIGVYAHEQRSAQPIRLDLQIGLTAPALSDTDTYEDVVCYDQIVAQIRSVIAADHINLVETLAQRVAAKLFANALIETLTIRIEKPIALAEAQGVGIECKFLRTAVSC